MQDLPRWARRLVYLFAAVALIDVVAASDSQGSWAFQWSCRAHNTGSIVYVDQAVFHGFVLVGRCEHKVGVLPDH